MMMGGRELLFGTYMDCGLRVFCVLALCGETLRLDIDAEMLR